MPSGDYKYIDLTGKRFGRLVVVRREGVTSYWSPTWLCRCDCGNEKVVTGEHLRRGKTKSCGCFRRERMRKDATKKV